MSDSHNKKEDKWSLVTEKIAYQNERFKVREAIYSLSGQEFQRPYYCLELGDWVQVVALTEDYKFILVQQFRHGANISSIEAPGGHIEPGDDPKESGLRELKEETGYSGDEIEELQIMYGNPALQNNRMFIYLLKNAKHVGEAEPEETEDIDVILWTPQRLKQALFNNEIHNPYAVAGLYAAIVKLGL
jgi:ADP-ribose pyrophosphatase